MALFPKPWKSQVRHRFCSQNSIQVVYNLFFQISQCLLQAWPWTVFAVPDVAEDEEEDMEEMEVAEGNKTLCLFISLFPNHWWIWGVHCCSLRMLVKWFFFFHGVGYHVTFLHGRMSRPWGMISTAGFRSSFFKTQKMQIYQLYFWKRKWLVKKLLQIVGLLNFLAQLGSYVEFMLSLCLGKNIEGSERFLFIYFCKRKILKWRRNYTSSGRFVLKAAFTVELHVILLSGTITHLKCGI